MRYNCFWGALVLLVGSACSDAVTEPPQPDGRDLSATTSRNLAGNRYIVRFRDDVTDVPALARSLAESGDARVHFVYNRTIKGFAATVPAPALSALRSHPAVERVVPDGQTRIFSVGSWGLDRIDQRQLPLDASYTPFDANGSGVTVYVIDGGIYSDHNEFGSSSRVVTGHPDAFDALRDTTSTYYAEDCWEQDAFPNNIINGHGTHVAGTIGGGTYGVAPGVTFVSVRVFECDGIGFVSDMIAGVEWITENFTTPAVVNLSGGASDTLSAIADFEDAVQASISAGLTYVVAAGNDNTDACGFSPGQMTGTITVAASDSTDARWTNSNYGSCVDIFAPGAAIRSAYVGASGSAPNSTATLVASGTSMATPHVAGMVARFLGDSASATPSQARSHIMSLATSGELSNRGTGSPDSLAFWPRVLTALIDGPTAVEEEMEYTWYAMVGGGDYSYQYQWKRRFVYGWGPGMWSNVGTADSLSLMAREMDPDFELMLTVDSGVQSKTDDISVSGFCDPCPEFVRKVGGDQ